MLTVTQYIEKHGQGPHQWSNYVVYPGIVPPGRIVMAEFPYRFESSDTDKFLGYSHPTYQDYLGLLKKFPTGLQIICLQEKAEMKQAKMAIYHHASFLKEDLESTGLAYLLYDNTLEIPDVNIIDDDRVRSYVEALYGNYIKGRNYMIHCMGGHGRTGVISALLLGYILVGQGTIISSQDLLNVIQTCHDQRITKNGWYQCPQTGSQKDQIKRLYEDLLRSKNRDIPKSLEVLHVSSSSSTISPYQQYLLDHKDLPRAQVRFNWNQLKKKERAQQQSSPLQICTSACAASCNSRLTSTSPQSLSPSPSPVRISTVELSADWGYTYYYGHDADYLYDDHHQTDELQPGVIRGGLAIIPKTTEPKKKDSVLEMNDDEPSLRRSFEMSDLI